MPQPAANSSNGATNTTSCSRTTVRHLCLISISLYLALRRLLSMFINLLRCCCCCPSMGQVFLHCGCCSTSPHACKSVCVSLSVCGGHLKDSQPRVVPPTASLCPLFTLSTAAAAASVRFTWQKLCAVSTFDYCWGSFCLPEARYMYTQVHINIPH